MVFTSFQIILDNPSGFFSPGQTVTGIVHIANNEVETLKGLHAEFKGKAKVKIPGKERKEENENSTSPAPKEEFYCDKEKYFEIQYSLYNPGSQVFDLSVGQHDFPFTFVLPMQIPSSFEGEFGQVRYTIKAIAKLPLDKSEYKCKLTLVVCSYLDLNTIAGAAVPVSKMKSKKICCLCCASGPISAQARIERAGYVPGETIIVNADTENNSRRNMQGSKIQLVQTAKFLAEGQTRTSSKVLLEYTHGEFTDSDIMENVPLIVPPCLPPSDLPFCGIINVSYQVQYVVDPGSFSISLTVPLDVIIGTVPLYNSSSFAHGGANIANPNIGFAPVAPGIPNAPNEQGGFNHWVMPNWQGGGPGVPTAPPPLQGEYFPPGEPVKSE